MRCMVGFVVCAHTYVYVFAAAFSFGKHVIKGEMKSSAHSIGEQMRSVKKKRIFV